MNETAEFAAVRVTACPLVSRVLHIATQEEAVSIAGQIMEMRFAGEQSDRIRDVERKQTLESTRMKGERFRTSHCCGATSCAVF